MGFVREENQKFVGALAVCHAIEQRCVMSQMQATAYSHTLVAT